MTKYSDALIKIAQSQLGYAEKANGNTKFGEWFQETHAKDPGFTDAAWCDMFVSWTATKAGQQKDVGQFAWTPEHAKWYEEQGAWGSKPEPGAVVFFDWKGSNDIDAIDHVGLVKSVVNGTTVKTIEGNIDDQVVSEIRDHSTIVGYGYPEKVREKNQIKLAKTKAEAKTGTQTAQAKVPQEQPDAGTPAASSVLLVPALLLAVAAKRGGRLGKFIPSSLRKGL